MPGPGGLAWHCGSGETWSMAARDLEGWIGQEIAACGGDPVLLLGSVPAPRGGANVTAVQAPERLAALDAPQVPYRLAVVVGVLERMDPQQGAALLASLRDLRARRVLVAVPGDGAQAGHPWTLEEMLAHGLERLGEAACGGRALAVYGFDIDRYKRTPDWLNPRHWANPENWDKYRW